MSCVRCYLCLDNSTAAAPPYLNRLWLAAVFADDFGDFLFANGSNDRNEVFEFFVEINFQLPFLEGLGQLGGGEAGFFCPEWRWFFRIV